ncbi:hypothetical protein FNU76_22195 [Chitinimonas arctica]|uniref:Phosphoglycerate mutase n=1 Tax=Chitinimonas arctica TaxID=2594795 RepID=A0A516SL06_9NEIS|nr:hypothetical protein [Chitinimonas arctica]QDQ28840.1 hypothetical protein FNU76_22195 [Chitinimonas arctica]
MTFTLVVPDLRFSRQAGFNPLTEMALPGLASLLGRADRNQLGGQSAEQWLRGHFKAESAGAAALSRLVDLPAAAAGHWLRADPVHLRADRDRALLFDAGLFDISAAEAEQLLSALNSLYAADGFEFVMATPQRWYVRLPQAPDFHTTPLSVVTGQDIHPHLPGGPTALQWHRFLNEVQMLLYGHAVNDAREQAGKPPVNSVWLWGEGPEPTGLAKPCRSVRADDAQVQGLALAAGLPFRALPPAFDASGADGELVLLDTLGRSARQGDLYAWRAELERLEAAWFQPLLAAWRAGSLPRVQMILPGDEATLAASLGPAERWKIWRRPARLEECLVMGS